MRRTGTTRRSALTATGAFALGAVLTGCGGGQETATAPGGTDAAAASLRAGKALRASAARDSASLLTRYEQVAAAHPVTEPGLAPMGAAVREHLTALGGPAKASGGSPAPAPPAAATDARAALKELAAEERRVADGRATALLTAEPELARLLASIAAAGAAHAYLLTELAKETPA
ncbi:hypothetical protein B046DRAFT_07017 [Streptomyces sp. LamerLS-316]|uniref:hypothetical protein n=1 Tax=unclassified Streptomyces TaxID=2593676 RepID=UPI000823DE88|nr:hypothetical protein [Streptomyces sp. LamerLS-316]MYQ38881.1 hypothetical protein [Streptomyces sp. SID4921]SCK26039.1 hypothetical protein B046DRAFT_07017 [Streptomyces sp. LamerLS-316]